MWECQFDKEINEDEQIKEYIDRLDLATPLNPRDAFYGRRTEGFQLYEETTDKQTIK